MTANLPAPASSSTGVDRKSSGLTPRQRLTAIRNALGAADQLLADAYAAEDWRAFGHPSWAAYCAAELPELRMIRLTRPERRQRVADAAAAGLSAGAIAAAYGIAKDTAWRDVRAAGTGTATVVSSDGRRRPRRGAPRPTPPAPAVPLVDQLVRLLAERGPLSCEQIKRELHVEHQRVSAALSRLAKGPRVNYTPGPRRGTYGTYSAA